MDIVAKLTLIFSGTGAIAGIISGFMPNAWLALLIALILLYASYKLTTSFIKKSTAQPTLPAQQTPEQTTTQTPTQPLPGKKKTLLKGFAILFATLVTKGEAEEKETELRFWFWPYYIMWLVMWVMVYTILLLR